MKNTMNFNVKLFFKINELQAKKNRWLDAFGRAGAEWVIVAMVAWYGAAAIIDQSPNQWGILVRLMAFGVCWIVGWLLNVGIGILVKEPRPHVTYPESKLLFQPRMSWKSFPSDHAMTAWLTFFLGIVFNLPGVEVLFFLALWVCWGRVYAGVHYPFDTLGGMLVAALVSMVTVYTLVLFF